MLTYQFPTNVTLQRVLQEYVIRRERLRLIKLFPFLDVAFQKIRWDVRDNVRGLTKTHVMGTEPKIGVRPGSVLKEYSPFYFKEEDLIKEDEILRARELGTLGGVINLDLEIARTMQNRVDRNFLRAEWLLAGMVSGAITLDDPNVKASEVFPVQHFADASDWTDRDHGTPLKDFNAIKLLFRGTGASAQGAIALMNQTTCNLLLENVNDKDIHGLRSAQNLASITYDMEQVNKILQSRGLPLIEVYDEGYNDDDGNFQMFFSDYEVSVIGKRAEPIANFALTPSLHQQAAGVPEAGFFAFITVNGGRNPGGAVDMDTLGSSGNPKIGVIGGMYGGPLLWYPRSIVRFTVHS